VAQDKPFWVDSTRFALITRLDFVAWWQGGLECFFVWLAEFLPVREDLFIDFKAKVIQAGLQALLGVGNCLVVDAGADLLKEETQQRPGGDVANWGFHVFLEITLKGFDGLLAFFLVEFDAHGGFAESENGQCTAFRAGGRLASAAREDL